MPNYVSHPDEVIVLKRRFGQGAADIDKYLELDGYKAVQKAIENGPDWIINEMKASGLRGRGGFPDRYEMELRTEAEREAEVCAGERRRVRARDLQGPRHLPRRPALGD